MKQSQPSEALARFQSFRQAVRNCLGSRKNTLSALLDALLTARFPKSLVQLCLAPGFEHKWPSVYDALNNGTVDEDKLRELFHRTSQAPTPGTRPIWVGDSSMVFHPRAETFEEQRACHKTGKGRFTEVLPGREYVWLTLLPKNAGCTVLPLDVRLRPATAPPRQDAAAAAVAEKPTEPETGPNEKKPETAPKEKKAEAAPNEKKAEVASKEKKKKKKAETAPTATEIMVAMIQNATKLMTPEHGRPVTVLDAGFGIRMLTEASLDANVLVRCAKNRVFYRAPEAPTGPRKRGAPKQYGSVFRIADQTTWGLPDREAQRVADPECGTVVAEAWSGLRMRGVPKRPVTILRVTCERWPRHVGAPGPLWLVWIGGDLPDNWLQVWQWYRMRFRIEHGGFRFGKQDLHWALPRLQHAQAMTRWTWLVAYAQWLVWLARPIVTDLRLPWEKPVAPDKLSPGRTKRALADFLLTLPRLAEPVRPRGKSSGRKQGALQPARQRFRVATRRPSALKKTA